MKDATPSSPTSTCWWVRAAASEHGKTSSHCSNRRRCNSSECSTPAAFASWRRLPRALDAACPRPSPDLVLTSPSPHAFNRRVLLASGRNRPPNKDDHDGQSDCARPEAQEG